MTPGNGWPQSLVLSLAQMALERELDANRAKIVRLIEEAASKGCRAVVFPESALMAPAAAPRAEIDAAIEAIQEAARANTIYTILGLMYRLADDAPLFNALLVIDPQGRVIHTYYKLWDVRPNRLPGLFHIDGIPCSAIICADRWLRGVEDLPAVRGSRILFECSNNYPNEWIPDLGWYWYVPRALRNGVYVVFTNTAANPRYGGAHEYLYGGYGGHGHSAVIAPDGQLSVAGDETPDRLWVAALDLSLADGSEAARRSSHPVFKPFWEAGLQILDGGSVDREPLQSYVSPAREVTIAVAQMACSSAMADNLAEMARLARGARSQAADLVVFPELCVTGARARDIERADAAALDAALHQIQQLAREQGIQIVLGMPYFEDGQRRNGALVVGPEGELLARHAQIVVDRPELFTPGTRTRSMWFQLRGIPAVVTLGRREGLWNEIAELAAVRGAQLHVHLEYDPDTTPAAGLLRKQIWVNLADYRTLTATANAASPAHLPRPSADASGGSVIWEDSRRHRGLGYHPYSPLVVAEAGSAPQVICATHTLSATNLYYERVVRVHNQQMEPWYELGAQIIDAEGSSQ
jgi:predicted amidohydrolase